MRLFTILVFIILSACSKNEQVVTVYVSHDRNLSEPILKSFSTATGIQVNAVYDIEANKTTGLVNRILAEKSYPHADVFWNNEVGRTLQLKKQGVLAPYLSATRYIRHVFYFDPEGYWTGFAARARVFVVNSQQVSKKDSPEGLSDLTNPRWRGEVAIGNPHFGTTGTHFTALYEYWGEPRFREWIRALRNNNVALLPGNAQVRDKVAAGRYRFGLTDTDDVNGAMLDGKSVYMIIPDQGKNGFGVFIIPNTVALIRGGPNSSNGKKLIDYLLSVEVEEKLAKGRGAQIPLQPNVKGPDLLPPLSELQQMQVSYTKIGLSFERMLRVFEEEWSK